MPVSASVLLNRLLARGKFRHLQVLLRVAELGSVQRAADAIGLTQSSVTQTLAYLEALLEQRLFQRHARGVTPTPECTELLPVARQVLMGLAEGSELVAARQRRGGGVVRLLASQAALLSLLMPVLPGFHRRHPGIQLHLREAEGEDQLLALARGEVDLVACRQPVALPEGWQFTPLREDGFVVVCQPGHPLTRRRRIDWRLLGREVWMLAPAETAARLRFDEVVQRFHGEASSGAGHGPDKSVGDAPGPAGAPAAGSGFRSHPMVTRSLTLMRDVLQREPVLALLPLSIVGPDIAAGRLAQLPLPEPLPLAPLGLLQPLRGAGEAVQRLARWVAQGGADAGPASLPG